MKKLKVMENRNRYFLLTVAITMLAIVGIFVPTLNKTATNFGGYRLSYTYTLEAAPVEEGVLDTAVTTLFPNMSIEAPESTFMPINMVDVMGIVGNTVNAPVTLIESSELSATNVVTFEVTSNSYPSDTLVQTLTAALQEKFPSQAFYSTSVTPVVGHFTRNFTLIAAVTAVILMVIICLWLGFRLSEIGGWNVGLLVAVNVLFVLIVTTSMFALTHLPIGNNFMYVSMAMAVISMCITMISFQYLQDESSSLSKSDLFAVLDQTISTLLNKFLIVCGIALLLIILGFIPGLAISNQLAIPVGVGLIASVFSTLFFALPFWGSSLELENEPEKSKEQFTGKKKSKKADNSVDTERDTTNSYDEFSDSEAARLAVEQGGAKSAGGRVMVTPKRPQANSSPKNYPGNKSRGKGKGGKKKKRK